MMFLKEYVKLGEPMNMNIDAQVFKTKLLDFVGDMSFLVYRPTTNGKPVSIVEGQAVRFFFFRPDGAYGFLAIFEKSYLQNNMYVCRFSPVSNVEKNQRRNSYRLPVLIDVWIWLRKSTDEEQKDIKAISVNLSETGMLFISPKPYKAGEHVRVQLRLEKYFPLMIDAEVMRCEPPDNRKDPYKIAVRFVDMPNRVRKHVSQYIMRQQVIMRKKEDT